MTKLTTSRLFDTGLIGRAQVYQELQPFFDYQTQLNENLMRVLINGVGLRDNLDVRILTVTVRHGEFVSVAVPKPPLVVLVGRQTPLTPALLSFVWDVDAEGRLRCRATTDAPTSGQALDLTLVVFFS
jgi:hypothetical protein